MALGRSSGWPVLRRCHILRWDWSVLPLAHHTHFPFWELWCTLVSVCFHNLVTYAQRLQDLYSACLMFWMRARHTWLRFIVSSKGREIHQSQVWAATYKTWKSLSRLTGFKPRTLHTLFISTRDFTLRISIDIDVTLKLKTNLDNKLITLRKYRDIAISQHFTRFVIRTAKPCI
jgi:hypothetical protein